MRRADIIRAFDATVIHEGPVTELVTCPECGRETSRNALGHVQLCLYCSEDDCGEYLDELRMRVSRKMLRRAFYALPRDSDGRPILPTLTWKAWRKLRGGGG